MSVRVITSIKTKPGAADEFIATWDRKRQDDVIGLPGCDQYELFQSALEPERLYVLESWQSRSAFYSAWKIIRVQVPVGEQLLAEPTDQPHSGYRTELYWDQQLFEPGDSLPAGSRLIANQNIDPGYREAFVAAWKSLASSSAGSPSEHDLLLGTRHPENIAELGGWDSAADLASYAAARFGETSQISEFIASPDERMSGEAGVEVYPAPGFYRWDGAEWIETAGATV